MGYAAFLFLVWLLFGLAGAGVTVWLVRRIWRQRSTASSRTKLIAGVVAASATFGGLGVLVGLVKAFGAVGGESVDPSQKARILAEGISEAMNCTAFSLVVWLPSIIVAFVMTRRSKDRGK